MKKIHKASKIRQDGAVSALCFSSLRAIDLKRSSWTNCDDFVTCSACKDLLIESKKVFEYNKEHAIGTCVKCGKEMIFNIPRLGANGGFIHSETCLIEC